MIKGKIHCLSVTWSLFLKFFGFQFWLMQQTVSIARFTCIHTLVPWFIIPLIWITSQVIKWVRYSGWTWLEIICLSFYNKFSGRFSVLAGRPSQPADCCWWWWWFTRRYQHGDGRTLKKGLTSCSYQPADGSGFNNIALFRFSAGFQLSSSRQVSETRIHQ